MPPRQGRGWRRHVKNHSILLHTKLNIDILIPECSAWDYCAFLFGSDQAGKLWVSSKLTRVWARCTHMGESLNPGTLSMLFLGRFQWRWQAAPADICDTDLNALSIFNHSFYLIYLIFELPRWYFSSFANKQQRITSLTGKVLIQKGEQKKLESGSWYQGYPKGYAFCLG
jgi:hypothetical protein